MRALLETWVNGRKIHDGIPMTLRQQIDSALDATTPAQEEMGCQICKGAKGVPGNEQIINGIVVCDYCHVAYIREEGGDGE